MYNYPHYKEHDAGKILEFMRAHPFVTLIAVNNKARIEATQIPVLIDEREGKIFLRGHIARKSDHHKALTENPSALILFTSPHTYVSGTWYSGNPQQASTWNYVSVHARGEFKWMGEEGLIELLKDISLHFENNNKSSSTIYENLPAEYLEKLVKAIIGFEMEITEMDNVYKLSQNRDEKSYDNIVKELKGQEGDGKIIAEWMEERKPKVFPS